MSTFIFVVVLAVIYLLWTILMRQGVKKLTCQRSFSRRTAFEGETGELIETVRNDGPYIIPWLRVESRMTPNLRLGKQDNLQVSGDTFYRSWFTLMPYQQIRRKHHVEFLRRGEYDLGNASICAGDLLGLTRFWKDQQLNTPITVYPQVPDIEDLPYPLSQTMGDLITKSKLLQDPFLIRGIRPYQPGDLIRDIHWQATARTEELQMRVREHTVCTRLMVVFNAQSTDDQWDNYIRDRDVDAVENTIRLTASMCIHGLRNGLAVGFATNMPTQAQGESTVIEPVTGAGWEDMLLESFARLQLHCSEKFIPLLQSLSHLTDTDIVVLSPYNSDSIQQALELLRTQGNQVTFYQLEGGAL